MLAFVSVMAISATSEYDGTVSLNRNRGERGCSFEVVRHQACRRGSGSESQCNGANAFHFDGWMVGRLDGIRYVEWCQGRETVVVGRL